MRGALEFSAWWLALVVVVGTAWKCAGLIHRRYRHDVDAYTEALEADAAVRVELHELEALWDLPASEERAPG